MLNNSILRINLGKKQDGGYNIYGTIADVYPPNCEVARPLKPESSKGLPRGNVMRCVNIYIYIEKTYECV